MHYFSHRQSIHSNRFFPINSFKSIHSNRIEVIFKSAHFRSNLLSSDFKTIATCNTRKWIGFSIDSSPFCVINIIALAEQIVQIFTKAISLRSIDAWTWTVWIIRWKRSSNWISMGLQSCWQSSVVLANQQQEKAFFFVATTTETGRFRIFMKLNENCRNVTCWHFWLWGETTNEMIAAIMNGEVFLIRLAFVWK